MTTYLGKSCSFGLPRVPFVNCGQFMYLVISLFGFEGRMWDLIVSVPDHCLSLYFINLIEWTFKREGSLYIAGNERHAFFTSGDTKRYKLWSCQALIYLLDNIYIRFGTKLYRQIVCIPMATNCAPLVADLFVFCYEKRFLDVSF